MIRGYLLSFGIETNIKGCQIFIYFLLKFEKLHGTPQKWNKAELFGFRVRITE